MWCTEGENVMLPKALAVCHSHLLDGHMVYRGGGGGEGVQSQILKKK